MNLRWAAELNLFIINYHFTKMEKNAINDIEILNKVKLIYYMDIYAATSSLTVIKMY
jgi:hypothetical protein